MIQRQKHIFSDIDITTAKKLKIYVRHILQASPPNSSGFPLNKKVNYIMQNVVNTIVCLAYLIAKGYITLVKSLLSPY